MRNIVLLTILGLTFCSAQLALSIYFPTRLEDGDVWDKYFITKDAIYDTMFLVFSLLLFWNFKEPLPKALTVFLVIVTGGSFIDKVIFDLNQYLLSDIVLVAIGIILSVIKYRKWKTLKHGA